jgi:LuxR family maltose regulon positive regulatory protein
MQDELFYSNVPMGQETQLYLDRPQIDDLLEKAVRSALATVTAGAGYGKTHAVYSFVRKYNAVTVWIQLFERDNLGWSFWGNFCRAVEFISSESAALFRDFGFPDTEQKFNSYLKLRQNQVLPEWKYIFVYDDFHLIREPSVLRFIEQSIATSSPNISTVLIARTEPKINTMPMLSKGFLTRITEDDMRFSPEEIRKYFLLQGLDVQSSVHNDVCRDTEGWAFAVHLAALTLKKSPPGAPYVPSSVKLNIVNLIESEVVSVISKELRKFLIKISLIDHLSMDILSDIAGETGVLEELGQIGSFVRYDPYLHIWRVHRLFLEYLIDKQGELTEEEKRDVYSKAARWCADNNLNMDALSYYEKAGVYEKVFDILYTLPLLLPRSIGTFILELLDRAPESVYLEKPEAGLARMRVLISLERFEEAVVGLRAIADRLEAKPLAPEDVYKLARCYFIMGLSGFVTCMHTGDYTYVRYFERAHYYYRQIDVKITGVATVVLLSSYICRVHSAEQGEIEKFIAALEITVPLVVASYGGSTYGMDDLAWAELAFFRNEVDRAEQMAYQALFKAQEKNQHEIVGRAIFYLMRISIFNGNTDKLEELLKRGEALLGEPWYLNRSIYYDIQMGWLYSKIGQADRVAPWLKSEVDESDLNSIASGLNILVRANYYYARGEYGKALRIIQKDTGTYSLGGFLLGRIEECVLEAMCLYAMKDTPGAMLVLEDAYSLALPNGFDTPFIECGKNIRPLYAAALKNRRCSIPHEWLTRMLRGASAYAKKLYMVEEKFRERRRKDKEAPSVFLSRQERSVLAGLSRGLTRQELAEDSSISINTIKGVIKSLYSKLGALNSADAVRIAVSIGILKNSDPEEGAGAAEKGLTSKITQKHFS